jgi:hypothetical protein
MDPKRTMPDPNLLASNPICIRLPSDLDSRLREWIASLPKPAPSISAFVRALIERELAGTESPAEHAARIARDARQLSLRLG